FSMYSNNFSTALATVNFPSKSFDSSRLTSSFLPGLLKKFSINWSLIILLNQSLVCSARLVSQYSFFNICSLKSRMVSHISSNPVRFKDDTDTAFDVQPGDTG